MTDLRKVDLRARIDSVLNSKVEKHEMGNALLEELADYALAVQRFLDDFTRYRERKHEQINKLNHQLSEVTHRCNALEDKIKHLERVCSEQKKSIHSYQLWWDGVKRHGQE